MRKSVYVCICTGSDDMRTILLQSVRDLVVLLTCASTLLSAGSFSRKSDNLSTGRPFSNSGCKNPADGGTRKPSVTNRRSTKGLARV